MSIYTLASPGRNWGSLNVVLSVCKSSSTSTAVHQLHTEPMYLLQRIASTCAEDTETILTAKLVKMIQILKFQALCM